MQEREERGPGNQSIIRDERAKLVSRALCVCACVLVCLCACLPVCFVLRLFTQEPRSNNHAFAHMDALEPCERQVSEL